MGVEIGYCDDDDWYPLLSPFRSGPDSDSVGDRSKLNIC